MRRPSPLPMKGLFPSRLETRRLLFEQISHENVGLFELYRVRGREATRDKIGEYLPWEPHQTPKETADLIDLAESEWNNGKAARYILRTKTDSPDGGEIVGYTKLEVDWPTLTGSLGIWLRKPYWGCGLSGERVDAVLALAFERLSLEVIEAVHQDGNEKSRRAIEKYVDRYGGQYEGLLRNWQKTSDGIVDVHRYTITAEQYADSPHENAYKDFCTDT